MFLAFAAPEPPSMVCIHGAVAPDAKKSGSRSSLPDNRLKQAISRLLAYRACGRLAGD